jgi:hypothetical protein
MAASSDSEEESADCAHQLTEASQYPLTNGLHSHSKKNVWALCFQQRRCRLIDTHIVGHHLNYIVGLDVGVMLDSYCYCRLNCKMG